MIPKFRAWNEEAKEIEVFKTYEEISELFLALSADDGFYSIMQSTGLFDKNGTEIFEGDILKFNDEWADYGYEGYVDGSIDGINYVEIKAETTYFTFGKTRVPESSLTDLVENEHYSFEELVNDKSYEFEIIGNIYENKELLEV